MAEAGASPVQEIAFTLANGVEYVRAAIASGQDVDEFAPRLAFFFVSRTTILEEVAKFRAARRLWAHVMRDRFGATEPRALQLRFHTQTAGSTLTAQQPDNNIVRVAVQALAAVLGGTQSLHCNGRDEAHALPTEESARIALRTQQILSSESGVANTVDPLGGAWAVERATDEIERGARAQLDDIDAAGGTLAAIEAGRTQRQIQDAAYDAQQAIDRGEAVVVGVNRYTTDDPASIQLLRIDAETERRQIEAVRALRKARDPQAWQAAIAGVDRAARDGSNLVPPVIAAVEARATLGEIADTLRAVFGEHRDIRA
jgi:methylmalonyl-CoA mutase N-terminal domain/subunit